MAIPHSYSRVKEFELCQLRFYETVLLRKWGIPSGAALAEGDEIHAAMATALSTGQPLPAKFRIHQEWIDKVNRTAGELFIEHKWAITKDLKPTTWNSERAWLRTVADCGKINEPAKCALAIDWKNGKSINQKDDLQLCIIALVMLIHYPKIHAVNTQYIWLQEEFQTIKVVERKEARDMWAGIIPRIMALDTALNTPWLPEEYKPTYNRLCKNWCPVKSCVYNGQ
jgi:hypothetical protein